MKNPVLTSFERVGFQEKSAQRYFLPSNPTDAKTFSNQSPANSVPRQIIHSTTEPFQFSLRRFASQIGVTLLAAIAMISQALAADSQPRGYLTKSHPPGLRFGAPPKPPVISLEPQPINFIPPPVFVTEFADPTLRSISGIRTNPESLNLAPPSELLGKVIATSVTSQSNATLNTVPIHVIEPKTLVKYFRETNSTGREVKLAVPISFMAPVPEPVLKNSSPEKPK